VKAGGVALALLLSVLVGGLPAAQARYEPLGGGATKLSFDKSFLALLKKNGVKLEAVAPARMKGGTVTFPVDGGKFDPVAAKGTVEHDGTLVFKAGKRRLPFRALQVKTTQRRSPISVKAGGGQLKFGRAGGIDVRRSGFGDKIAIADLTLSAKVATRLGKKLRLKGTFKEGMKLGRSRTTTRPATIAVLERGKASLVLSSGFAAKLDSLFVAVNPIFPAEHIGAEFTIPIFSGTIAPNASSGSVELSGAIEFQQQAGGQAFWREPWVDLGTRSMTAEADLQPSPPFAGKVGRIAIASLGLTSPPVADAKARSVGVAGSLALDATTAATFNELFAKPQGKSDVFVAGEEIAGLSFTAEGQ
jgi:hypothetical protein